MNRIAFIKHGNVISEYRTITGDTRWTMADTGRPYILEMSESLEGRPGLFIGLDTVRSSDRAGNIQFEVIPIDRPVSKIRRVLNLLWYNMLIFVFLRRFSPDMVVVSGNFYNTFIPYIYSVLFKKKLLLILTGQLPENPGPVMRLLTVWYRKLVRSSRVAGLFSRGPFPLCQLGDVSDLNTKVIYPFYTSETFRDADAALAFGEFFELIFVGRLSREKGTDVLVDVMSRLGNGYRLTLVGDGPDRDWLTDAIAENGLNIRLVGFQEPKQVYGMMKKADILTVPSRSESLCKVTIEALFVGLPVVAFDVGGIGFNVENGSTGFLVTPGDTAGFVDSILKISGSEELRSRMKVKAIEKAGREFEGLEKLSELLKEVYCENIAG